MKVKRFLAGLLAVGILPVNFTGVTAEKITDDFMVISIPYEDNDPYDWPEGTRARYKDTKEPISLSYSYDGRIYGTVPKENADREIEVFETNELEFTDDNTDFEFFIMRQLSRTGIVVGNEKGEALPLSNITRAEAVAMIMRFLGLENVPKLDKTIPFCDVNKNDWFYSVVTSAYNYKIAAGVSETHFEPNRKVTREEITVMIARATELAKLGIAGGPRYEVLDEEEIALWAKDAYALVGDYIEPEYVDTATEVDPQGLLAPKKLATRYYLGNFIYKLIDRAQVYPSSLAVKYGFDKEMPVIDGSTSTYPFTEQVYNAMFSNSYQSRQKPSKHSKSHASYQRLINGEVDMIFASVYPASDILAMAEDAGVELELIPIAYDAMIFFTNADNPTEGLTSEQITNIYVNDAYENWSEVGGCDALMYPYCRNNDSGSHAQMERHFLNGNEVHPEVQKETSYAMADILTDVMGAKTESPLGYGLGYSIYYYYHNMNMFYGTETNLKLLAVDGVKPTDDTIADGTYSLSNNTYIVINKASAPDSPERKMAEFMLTEEGQFCVEMAGFGKLR